MTIIAASLYLPEHIAIVLSRAWFYYAGDEAAHVPVGEPRPGMNARANSGMIGAEMLDRL